MKKRYSSFQIKNEYILTNLYIIIIAISSLTNIARSCVVKQFIPLAIPLQLPDIDMMEDAGQKLRQENKIELNIVNKYKYEYSIYIINNRPPLRIVIYLSSR